MPMTRKDYQETAKFSEMFEKDNPRFDPERFEKATGANNLEFNF